MSRPMLSPVEALALLDTLPAPVNEKQKEGLEEFRKELTIAAALKAGIDAIGVRVANGEEVPQEEITALFMRVAEDHGIPYGIPVPAVGGTTEHPLIIARQGPLAWIMNTNAATEAAQRWEQSYRRHVRNSWEQLGDVTVVVVDTEDGPMWIKEPHAGQRLRKMFASLEIRTDAQMTPEAEMKALESLKGKINPQQYRTYVLSDMFIETSARSDLRYIFRKGKPTIVLSCHNEDQQARVLCALCFHPVGYYQYSTVGCMVPTDEVIAALLMMRTDERRFWAKSGQWSAVDPRASI